MINIKPVKNTPIQEFAGKIFKALIDNNFTIYRLPMEEGVRFRSLHLSTNETPDASWEHGYTIFNEKYQKNPVTLSVSDEEGCIFYTGFDAENTISTRLLSLEHRSLLLDKLMIERMINQLKPHLHKGQIISLNTKFKNPRHPIEIKINEIKKYCLIKAARIKSKLSCFNPSEKWI